jgi:hypothetical protein
VFQDMQLRGSLTPRLCELIERSSMRGAEVMMGAPSLASGTFLLNANLMEVPLGLIKSHLNILALLVHREYQQ